MITAEVDFYWMKHEAKSEKAGVSILTTAQHLKYISLPALRLGDLAPEILCWDTVEGSIIDVSTWLQINDHSNPYAYSNELLTSEVLSSKIQANVNFGEE